MITGKKKKQKRYPFVTHLFSYMVIAGLIWYIGFFFNLFCPYHAAYEYKGDISKLKESTFLDYSLFPNAIPQNANHVIWEMMPTFLQGSGHEGLFFYADEDYTQNWYQQLDGKTVTYRYDSESKTYCNNEETLSFPMMRHIPSGTESDTIVYVANDNKDWNHRHMNGVYLNRTEGFVCFFTE